jgi:PAS domain S-box-containing protein
MKQAFRFAWQPYVVAIVLIAAAAALRLWPLQALGVRLAWLTFYPAVVIATLYGGFSAGLLGTSLSCLTLLYLWPVFGDKPFIRDPADWLGMVVFSATCVMISSIGEAMRHARARAEQAKKQLETTNTKLQEEITERKRAAEALKDSEQRLALALDSGLMGAWDLDLIHDTAVRSLKHDQIFGYDSLLPQWGAEIFMKHIVPEDREHVQGKFQEAFASGYLHFECRIMRPDKSLRWIAAQGRTYRDEEGTPVRMMGVVSDITERKRAEELLRESEVRYHTLFDSIDEGYCIIEMIFDEQEKPVDYRFLVINPSFERQTGLRDALGKRMRELAPNHEEHWFEIYGSIAMTGEPARFENRAEQLHRWFDVYAFRFAEPEKRQVAILFNDITERKRAAEALQHSNTQLEAANKELEAFSYSVSHDLRAPLRHIDGFADLLSKKALKDLDSTSQHYLSTISKSAKFMGALIDNLLVFSRMSRSDIKRSILNPYPVIQEVIQNLTDETSSREIRWTIHPLPMVSADPMMLRLIFQNLLGNAVKYTRPRPRAEVEVGCKEQSQQYQFFVRDNGVGFDMKYANKLFGVFQRLHRADEFEGTGIGLANVQRIVRRHGGQTWAESTPGQGATFYFSLPAEDGMTIGSTPVLKTLASQTIPT